MSWQTYRQRRQALDDVLGDLKSLDQRASADQAELLGFAHQRWHNHLSTHVDAALDTVDEPAHAVAMAYRNAAMGLPAVRRLLDNHADHPAVVRAEQRELALVARAAALVPLDASDDAAAEAGRAFRAGLRTIRRCANSTGTTSHARRLRATG